MTTPRSTGDILSSAMTSVSSLVRNEVDLARAELAESVNQFVAGLVMIVIAAVLAIIGLNVLAGAAVAALVAAGLSGTAATLIVGGIALALGVIIALVAINRLKSISIAPKRTARNVARDAEAIKEAYNAE